VEDEMKFLSVCSGIEAVSVATANIGWEAVGFSEIEPLPCSVLAERFPHVPNFGNMENFDEWNVPEFDILAGGRPCQSFSIAGLRGGLQDERGNLALVYCRILQKFRPKWFLWENVPGVLSSAGGRDFGSILGAMVELGYGIAYRVLDAQYFGVPQRRRRVFIVGCLGDWASAAEVLFEPNCLRGDSTPSRKPKQEVAGTLSTGFGSRGVDMDQIANGNCVVTSLTSSPYADNVSSESKLIATSTGSIAHCLNAGGMGRQDYETETMVVYNVHGANSSAMTSNGIAEVAFPTRVSRSVDTTGLYASNQGGTVAVGPTTGVRRLTPEECELLQGFPKGWTLVNHRSKPAKDGPRYKAIGNSMAVPVIRWICKRIQEKHKCRPTSTPEYQPSSSSIPGSPLTTNARQA
jgi:DNA (cytosine-5)-methyltransferase 1